MDRFGSAPVPYPSVARSDAERVGAFLRATYGWMAAGVGVTALVALTIASSPTITTAILHNRLGLLGIVIAQFAVVIFLSARVNRVSPTTAAALFMGYSALTGVTFSIILLAYTKESVAGTFFVCAGMFGALAAYGTVTQRNLTGLGQVMFMGLIGLVIASVVGIFWQNDLLQFLLSFIGVIVFSGLTAYKAQQLTAMALAIPEGQSGSYAVVGALSLYLSFVNLFLSLIRLFGGRRD
jgi:FtsH-binding integral membrane protein